MSKVLKVVGKVAGLVGTVAQFIPIPGAAAVGKVLMGVSAVATLGSELLSTTAPRAVARGSVTQVVIEVEPPRPYLVGEAFSAGVLRHQVAYGATLKDVPNPNMLQVKVFSSVGPVEQLVGERFDFAPIGSYYNGFYSSDTQLGARPESTALVPPYGTAPGWGAASKLSGCAAIASNYKFDREGKVYSNGTPLHGAIWKGEMCYDPRLDSTYPGGSGSHRLGDESTYTYSRNPALHAATYAYGRYENNLKVFGIGVSEEAIDWASVVDWANDCDTNGWTANGTIWEGGRSAGMQQRVANLDDLCAAGGGRWIMAGAMLSFDWHHPRVSLATLTDDDLLEEGISAVALQSLRSRMNGVRPQYVSPSHNWEQITADEIVGSTYRTEDGQNLTQTWPLNLVTNKDQAGELASYAMTDSREIGPIELTVGQEWRFYRPGETLTLNSDLLGYNGQVVILERGIDPATLNVTLKLKSETAGKHDFALGKTATPPPTPLLTQTGEQRDDVAYNTVVGRPGADGALGFSLVEFANVTTTGGLIRKTGGGVAWDASAHSNEAWIGGAQVVFRPEQTNKSLAVGLNADPTTDASISSIDYAIFCTGAAGIQIYESGSLVATAAGTYSAGDTFSIVYNGATVRYFHGATLLREVAAAAGLQLYLDTSLFTADGALTVLGFNPVGAAGTNGAAAVEITPQPPALMIPSYANGSPGDFSNAVTTIKMVQGATDIASNFTLSIPSGGNPQNLTASINNTNKTVTISGAGTGSGEFGNAAVDSATLTVRATGSGAYSSIVRNVTIALTKAKGGYEIVSSLPANNLFEGRVVYLSTDDKLYRYTGSAWSKAVDGADLVANSVTTNALNAGAVTAAKMDVTELSSITANVGLLRTATTGQRMEIAGTSLKVYYSNGVVAVEIGF